MSHFHGRVSDCLTGVLEGQLSSPMPLLYLSSYLAGVLGLLCTCTENYILCGKRQSFYPSSALQHMQSNSLKMYCKLSVCLFHCKLTGVKRPGIKTTSNFWVSYRWLTNSNFHLPHTLGSRFTGEQKGKYR